jgi:hypothetical protein
MNVACVGEEVGSEKDEWINLAKGDPKVYHALATFYDQFKEAPLLGSLIKPEESLSKNGSLFELGWDDIVPYLEEALEDRNGSSFSEAAVVAHGLSKAASLLTRRYTLIVTNVPYLSRGKQCDDLRAFCEKRYHTSKGDLATVFLERCIDLCVLGGTVGVVLPQNLLFLSVYQKFREKLFRGTDWHVVVRLGQGAFDSIDGNMVMASQLALSRGVLWPDNKGAHNSDSAANIIRCIDVSSERAAAAKSSMMINDKMIDVKQSAQLNNPQSRLVIFESQEDDAGSGKITLLKSFANSLVGIQTGDDPMFVFAFWELPTNFSSIWEYMQGVPTSRAEFSGQSWIVRWENGEGLMSSATYSRPTQGIKAVGKEGVLVNRMGDIFSVRYSKEMFHQNVAVLLPDKSSTIPAIWSFSRSPEFQLSVRQIDQAIKVTNATLGQVPFDFPYWFGIAKTTYPAGLPAPYSNDPTQKIFHGHPCGSVVWDEKSKTLVNGPFRVDATVLHVAVARLLGYQWPSELDPPFELADEQWEWAERCKSLLVHNDKDGIVCIPAVNREAAATDRLLNLLVASYGKNKWSNDVMSRLLASAECSGRTLEGWLRDKFFAQHCKLFHNRPFIWQIFDGHNSGFSALVNYHKFDFKLLETLTFTYLGDWIARQKHDIGEKVSGAEERLVAAEALKKRLVIILEGENPYDIFVRWKPMDQQPLGWNPDLNDGVRLNIRPFMMPPDIGKKGAGLLRAKPNISWEKDRGKDMQSSPWYHVNHGDRVNNRHLTLKEKRERK